MTDVEVKLQIEKVLLPYLQQKKIELVEFNLNRYRTTLNVQVLVEMPEGIGIEECTDVNKFLSRLLEEEGWIPGDWTLEVSSPGLDRPLTTLRDFQRMIGRPMAVYLNPNDRGFKLEYRGTLKSADGAVVLDQTSAKSGKSGRKSVAGQDSVSIPMELIRKGTLIF